MAQYIGARDSVHIFNRIGFTIAKGVALRSSLERIVTASGLEFDDWQWRLATLPFAFGGLGVYFAGDVLNYAFLVSRLQSAGLQTKLLRHTSIVSPEPIFDDALSVFNTSMETDLLSNPSEIAAPKLMKKMADIYFTQVTKNAESTFSLSPRQMALWTSQREDHTSDWLRTIPISGLGQTMNDHVVSCAGIIGIKHRHNVVCDTLVDICYRSGISAGNVKCGGGKYMAKCAAIGYVFLPFSFSSLGELEADAVTLLKRIGKFFMTQDIEVLKLIMEDGPGCGLHLNVDKTEVFWPKEDPRSRLACIFRPNIARPLHGVKLLGGPASVDFDFCNELVMKRVTMTIELMDAIAKINDPQCELLLLRTCAGISRLYFTMHTCPPRVFASAQRSFDVALRSSLERIVTASGPGFGNWQWRLATLPFAFGGLGVYSAGDVLNYAFLASRLQSVGLQTKLLRHTGIDSPSFFGILMALWTSQMEDHTSDWLRTVPISGLRQTMNACSRVFAGDIYGDHVVSCAGIIGIKHRHNVVHDTLVDICYRSGISAGKKVDIGLDGGRDKPLRPADMLLYSWDGGLDVCVDLTGSSPLTQTGMVNFVPGRAVIDAAQRKRDKYMAKCADIGYGFLPFSFSSLGELEADAVTLLKRIRKFSMAQDIGARAAVHIFNRISFAIAKGIAVTLLKRIRKFSMAQDIGARAAVHIFNRISFAIAKGVGAQIVSRLPSNLL
ncbi:hypothetical protein Tco_0233155 [Tanacetum coccineum]